MQNYLFYHETEGYKLYQRTHFSNVFIITKHANLKQYMDPDFFFEIINAPFTDPDILFAFPWSIEIDLDKRNQYILNYKKYWK